MTPKERIIDELKKTERDGIDNLITAMEEGKFFTAPCSGSFHLAEPEGLAKHSLNVLEYARKLNEAWGRLVADDSLVIVSLLHDLGKMGAFNKPNYIENVLKSGKAAAKPYKTNPDLLYVPHEIRSIVEAERWIHLSEDEEFAILYHNGMYSELKYSYSGKETILSLILHFADLWCSRVVEIEDDGKEEKE